jgi:hypothetical protein
VAAAITVAHRLAELAVDPDNFPAVGELFRQVNARLFVRFREVPQGKRRLRKSDSGVVTFGDAAPPHRPLCGNDDRAKDKRSGGLGDRRCR